MRNPHLQQWLCPGRFIAQAMNTCRKSGCRHLPGFPAVFTLEAGPVEGRARVGFAGGCNVFMPLYRPDGMASPQGMHQVPERTILCRCVRQRVGAFQFNAYGKVVAPFTLPET